MDSFPQLGPISVPVRCPWSREGLQVPDPQTLLLWIPGVKGVTSQSGGPVGCPSVRAAFSLPIIPHGFWDRRDGRTSCCPVASWLICSAGASEPR